MVTRRTCNAKIACSIQAIGISQLHWINIYFALFGGVGLGESKLMVKPAFYKPTMTKEQNVLFLINHRMIKLVKRPEDSSKEK